MSSQNYYKANLRDLHFLLFEQIKVEELLAQGHYDGWDADSIKSTQDLLNQLNGIRIVSCTQAAWRFLGLSFAGWNAVVSTILTALSAYAAAGGFSSEPITIVRKTSKVAS